MKKILKGKDIHFAWQLSVNGTTTDLSDMDVTIELTDSYGVKSEMTYTLSESKDTVEFTYFGIDQKHNGPVKLMAWLNKGATGQSLIDKGLVCEIVPYGTDDFTYDETVTLELESSLTIGLKGASAYDIAVANGYEGTAEEWLASLEGKSAYEVWKADGHEDGTLEDFYKAIGGGSSAGAYVKPDGGIPKSDLSESVQSSLNKADTALQEHQSLVDYALKEEIPDISGLETMEHAAATYQPKGNYLTEHQDISGKVDKVDGKGLSTNDYTDADKSKLEGIEAGAQKNPTDYVKNDDSRLSDSRTPKAHTHTKSEITDFPSSMPASDVSDWAKQANKPSYSADEISTDESGKTVQGSLSDLSQKTESAEADATSAKEYCAEVKSALDNASSEEAAIAKNTTDIADINTKLGTTGIPYNISLADTNTTLYCTNGTVAQSSTRWIGYLLTTKDGLEYKISNKNYIYAFAEIPSVGSVGTKISADSVFVGGGDNKYILMTLDSTATTEYTISESASGLYKMIADVESEVNPTDNNVIYCGKIPTNVLQELYLPNVTSDWKIELYGVYEDFVRIKIKDADGVSHICDVGRNGYACDYNDKIHAVILTETAELIGYFIPRYDSSYVGSSGTYDIEVDKVTSLDYNPRIKAYLAQDENLLLCGDSLFGSSDYNTLSANMREASAKCVFNGGMPGCKMAIVGTQYYDDLTFPAIADAIYSDDWSIPLTSASAIYSQNSNSIYLRRLAELKAIDFSKPTTIFVEYCNNDLSGNVAKGNMWESGQGVDDFNKSTLLGALNYGIFKILSKYPTIRIVAFTPAWRYMGTTPTAPYLYHNSNDDTIDTFSEAIHDNCERIGISVYDFHKYGGRNEINRNTILADDSHYNVKGFALLAKTLINLDGSMLG